MNSESPGEYFPVLVKVNETITTVIANEDSALHQAQINSYASESQLEVSNEQVYMTDSASSSYVLNTLSENDITDTCNDISHLFRTQSPTYQEVIKLLYQECVNNAQAEAARGENIVEPKIDDVIITMKNFIFQNQDESNSTNTDLTTLLQNFKTQLELKVSYGGTISLDNFSTALSDWVSDVKITQRVVIKEDSSTNIMIDNGSSRGSRDSYGSISHIEGEDRDYFAHSYSFEATGGEMSPNKGMEHEVLYERIMILQRDVVNLQDENSRLKNQMIENEETIHNLSGKNKELDKRIRELVSSLASTELVQQENCSLRDELFDKDASISLIKQKLTEEQKCRQDLQIDLKELEEVNTYKLSDTFNINEDLRYQDDLISTELEFKAELSLALEKLQQLEDEKEELERNNSDLSVKNNLLEIQIQDLEQELKQYSSPTHKRIMNNTPPNQHLLAPSLHQEINGCYTPLLSSTPINSEPLSIPSNESFKDETNSSLEILLNSLSNDPQWKELCSLKSSNQFQAQAGEIINELDQLDCSKDYKNICDRFRRRYAALQQKLREERTARQQSDLNLEQLKTEYDTAKLQLDDVNQKLTELDKLRSSNETLSAELLDMENKLQQEVKTISDKSTELERLTQAKIIFDQTNQNLSEALQEKSAYIEHIEAQNKLLHEQREQLTQQLQDSVNKGHELSQKVDKLSNDELELAIQRQTVQELNEKFENSEMKFTTIQNEYHTCLNNIWSTIQGNSSDVPSEQKILETLEARLECVDSQQTFICSPSMSYKHILNEHASLSRSSSAPDIFTNLRSSCSNQILTQCPNNSLSSHSPRILALLTRSPSILNRTSRLVSNFDNLDLEDNFKQFLLAFSSSKYTIKSRLATQIKHLATHETKMEREFNECSQHFSKLETEGQEEVKILSRKLDKLGTTIGVVSVSARNLGILEQEDDDIDATQMLLEYMDFAKNHPNSLCSEDFGLRRRSSVIENPICEHSKDISIGNENIAIYGQENSLEINEKIDFLNEQETKLTQKTHELELCIKSIQKSRKSITFRGVIVNCVLVLSLFILACMTYLFLGPFPESLPVIRHRLLQGYAIPISSYFLNFDMTSSPPI